MKNIENDPPEEEFIKIIKIIVRTKKILKIQYSIKNVVFLIFPTFLTFGVVGGAWGWVASVSELNAQMLFALVFISSETYLRNSSISKSTKLCRDTDLESWDGSRQKSDDSQNEEEAGETYPCEKSQNTP